MGRNTGQDGKTHAGRKPTKLTLNRETLQHLADANQPVANATKACTATCIITGHPCPIPCG